MFFFGGGGLFGFVCLFLRIQASERRSKKKERLKNRGAKILKEMRRVKDRGQTGSEVKLIFPLKLK